jgi:hypothetical protein
MRSQVLPLLAAAGLGGVAAALSLSLILPRPAQAQFTGASAPFGGGGVVAPGNAGAAAQPLEIQALDADHFVVATREPRLVQQLGREGTAQSMLVTVVTHYTVRGDKLIPVEHVRVPAGYRAITLEQ